MATAMGISFEASRPLVSLRRRRERPDPPRPSQEAARLRALLYDAEDANGEVELDSFEVEGLSDTQLLWIDVADLHELPAVAAALRLTDENLAAILDTAAEPSATLHDGYAEVAVVAPESGEPGGEPVVVHVLVGANWVVTLHRRRVELLETFDERIRGGSELGLIDSQGFLAAILHEHVAAYLAALRPIEAELDRIDLRSLTGRMNEEALLVELVGARIRLARLRRLLEPHREVYARLSRPEFAVQWGSEAAAEFDAVTEFLERVLSSLDSAREMIAGSFDIYTTWAAHGTNQLIRRLTVASVTILPPTLLAGIMGMNSLPRTLATGVAFWATIIAMVSVTFGVLTLAVRRHWL